MYDPDRSQTITYLGQLSTWSDFSSALKGALNSQKAVKGAGLRILSSPTSSPTMASLMDQVQAAYPESKWIQWEPVNRDNVSNGSQLAFGQYVETRYDLQKADIIRLARRLTFFPAALPRISLLRAAVRDEARS